MIIHGMQDDIVLFHDSVRLIEKLMLLGKNFDLVVLPSSVHDGCGRTMSPRTCSARSSSTSIVTSVRVRGRGRPRRTERPRTPTETTGRREIPCGCVGEGDRVVSVTAERGDRMSRRGWIGWCLTAFAVGTAGAGFTAAIAARQASPERPQLTVARIAAWPNLAGTVPTDPVWSSDSRRLAFLWNDKGNPFLDVWIADAEGGAPRRVTSLDESAQPAESATADRDATLAAGVAARNRRGVSELVWTPDGKAVSVHLRWPPVPHRRRRKGDNSAHRGSRGATIPLVLARRAHPELPAGRRPVVLAPGPQERAQVTRFAKPARGTIPGGWFSRADAEVVAYGWAPDSQHLAIRSKTAPASARSSSRTTLAQRRR